MNRRENAIVPMTPAADQRGKEGYFVTVNGSDEAAVVTSAAAVPFGVITEGVPTGDKSSIALSAGGLAGSVQVKLASASLGTVKRGTDLVLTADGSVKADPGSGARVIVAQALEPGATDELIEAVIFKPVVMAGA